MLNEQEYSRWVDMARRTLTSSRRDLDEGDYNWSCFKAQQSAEFALKGLLRGLGLEAHDQSLLSLLSKLPEDLSANNILQAVKSLDKHYLPTRYTNAWAEGIPANYYTRQDARQAISYASLIIKWVEEKWMFLKRREREKPIREVRSEDESLG